MNRFGMGSRWYSLAAALAALPCFTLPGIATAQDGLATNYAKLCNTSAPRDEETCTALKNAMNNTNPPVSKYSPSFAHNTSSLEQDRLQNLWGPWSSLIDFQNGEPIFGHKDFMVYENGNESGVIRYAWRDHPKYGKILREMRIVPGLSSQIVIDWRINPQGNILQEVVHGWGTVNYKTQSPNVVSTPSGINGRPVEWVFANNTITHREWKEKSDETRVYTNEKLVMISPNGYDVKLAQYQADKEARRGEGGGLLGALGTIAQGAAVAMSSYNNTYATGAMPSGPDGMENPLDVNSAQNRAFQQNLQEIAQRAQTDAANSRSQSTAMPTGAPPQASSANAPRAVTTLSGRTISYALRVGVETRPSDTGNGVCFTGVITRHFPEWNDNNGLTVITNIISAQFDTFRQRCKQAGRTPLSYDPVMVETDVSDPNYASNWVNENRGLSYNSEVKL